jgi:MFS family permease
MKKKVKRPLSAEHPIIAKKIDRSLNLSVKEGSLAAVSTGFGFSYLSPFALALNATSAQMGILHAIMSLLPSLVQLKAATLIEKFSRKKISTRALLCKILLWIPIILTGLLFYLGVPHMAWVLIVLIGLFYACAAVAHPAWFSWMGSIVPKENRGAYFSKRNKAAGFFGIVTMISGAIILDSAKIIGGHMGNALGFTLFGFGLLFAISATTRVWSLELLKKQYEPRLRIRKKDRFSFWDFLKRAPYTNFGRFAIFGSAFYFVIGIAVPFWVVYMLRDLGFSYIWYMIITVASLAFQLMFLPLLGKVSDRFGNIRLMKICSSLIVLTPALWLVTGLISSDLGVKLYLLFIPSLTNGFAWAGYNLAVNNYIYDAVSSRKRSFGLSYMNLLIGLGTFAGASVGSLLAWLNVSFMNPLLFIFAISGIGRLIVVIIGTRFLHEVRHVKKFSSYYLVKEFHPVQGAIREIHHLEHLVGGVRHHL